MRIRSFWPALLLAFAAGCDDALTVEPASEVPEEQAITDANGARAALAGLYDALQDGSYYGGELLFFGDLPSDDVDHVGTFTDYGDADANDLRADNTSVLFIWDAIYAAIGRTNQLIARIPAVDGLSDDERNDFVGQAHFIRALAYHDLVKLWEGVPIRTEPPGSIDEASQIARGSEAEVYAQILSDLDQAETLISNTNTRMATVGAVVALRSRVLLYAENWAGAIAAADEVEALGYDLAPQFSDLFTPSGQDTPEDIFRVSFTPVEFNLVGFYYISRSFGGRREISPTFGLIDAFGYNADPGYDPDTLQTLDDDDNIVFNPADSRAAWSIGFDFIGRRYGSKYPTTEGAEHVHVIRFGEVLLNRAEAYTRLNQLDEAIADVNRIRVRAGLSELDATGMTQQQVLDIVWEERRLELAMEGFRWPDLVRTDRAVAVLGIPVFQTLFPIPQAELDVAPNIAQNPGY